MNTGEELWSFKMPYSGSSPPTIYKYKDEQYVLVPATGSTTMKNTYPKISVYGNKVYAFKIKKNWLNEKTLRDHGSGFMTLEIIIILLTILLAVYFLFRPTSKKEKERFEDKDNWIGGF